MSQGSRETLEQELEALLRQRDQYSLALDASTDPQASIRLQRTLDRLEDEIGGLREALAALPPEPMKSAPAPDWEDEPATAIFDPDLVPAPPVPAVKRPRVAPHGDEITQPVATVPIDPPPAAESPPPRKPSDELTDPARPLYDIDAEMERARDVALSPTPPSVGGPARVFAAPKVGSSRAPAASLAASPPLAAASPLAVAPPLAAAPPRMPTPPPAEAQPLLVPEPGAAQPLSSADPTISVTAPPEELDAPRPDRDVLFAVDLPTVAWRAEPKRMHTPSHDLGGRDPLGPVVLDALEPPTGENPREEAPADPFALPHAALSPRDWDPPFAATPVSDASPFGSTAVGPAAFDASNFPESTPEGEWSAASKILLALVVAGFLAAVGWVLTQ